MANVCYVTCKSHNEILLLEKIVNVNENENYVIMTLVLGISS